MASRRGVVGDDRDGLAKGANCGFQIPVLPFEECEVEERQWHVGPFAEQRAAQGECALEITGEILTHDLLHSRIERNQALRIVRLGEGGACAGPIASDVSKALQPLARLGDSGSAATAARGPRSCCSRERSASTRAGSDDARFLSSAGSAFRSYNSGIGSSMYFIESTTTPSSGAQPLVQRSRQCFEVGRRSRRLSRSRSSPAAGSLPASPDGDSSATASRMVGSRSMCCAGVSITAGGTSRGW